MRKDRAIFYKKHKRVIHTILNEEFDVVSIIEYENISTILIRNKYHSMEIVDEGVLRLPSDNRSIREFFEL